MTRGGKILALDNVIEVEKKVHIKMNCLSFIILTNKLTSEWKAKARRCIEKIWQTIHLNICPL